MSLMTVEPTETLTANGESRTETFSFAARDITGSREMDARVQRSAPAGAVAQALAARMSLPLNVPWALRDARRGAYLDEQKPIADQVQEGAHVDVVPKAHLG
jgi:hypothetical protein